MAGQQTRASLAVLTLLALWVVVYWWTPARESAAVEPGFDRNEVGPGARPSPPQGPPQQSASVNRGQPPVGEPSAVVPPSFKRYTVQSGDTAEAISQRIFGTKRHWQSIVQSNPLIDFSHLKAGTDIRVPLDPNNVQGVPASDVKPSVGEQDGGDARREVVVQSGDTLSSIAKREYGRSSMWTRILQANRDQLNDEATNLKPGMTLKIPAVGGE